MRRENNRRMINRLYILGAGASYSLTANQTQINRVAPLDAHFCRRICSLQSRHRPAWVAELASRLESEYLHHTEFQASGLEEVVRQQLSDYEFIDSIHPQRSRGKRTGEAYLHDIVHLVAYILSGAREKDPRLLEAWVAKYFRGSQRRPSPNRIITFNYDTIIDKYLLKWHSPQHVYFDNIKNAISSKPRRVSQRYPFLLKLHGSVNWRCTNKEYNKLFDADPHGLEGQTYTYNTDGCHYINDMWIEKDVSKPGDPFTPLIIPPLPQKPITSIAIFRYLWTYAYEYLYEARNIIVAGYSLPAADTLAVSLFSKFKNKRINNLTIVDPNEEALGKWIKLFRRNGIQSHEVHYYPDFQEYIAKDIS